ncbi:MAG TPA: HAD family hydrolase [Mycobacteriales bacterium]|nr:HAD family hydrolase [Mycobacteriales bacterium]
MNDAAARAVLFDVDGTLVDTNYHHAVTWAEAFRLSGHDVAASTCHGLIGQGSERLVESVLGHGDDAIVEAHSDLYGPQLHRLCALRGAADLLRRAKECGLVVVLATSASAREAEYLRRAIDADDAIDHVTTKDDVEESKPEPDIVHAALARAGVAAADAVFVGDTVWDVEAARRAGMGCVCVLTGGIAEQVLREAGALEVYRDAVDLIDRFDASAIGALARRG